MTRLRRLVPAVSAPRSADPPEPDAPADVAALILVRRIVGARVGGHPAADDLVQETLGRVLAALPDRPSGSPFLVPNAVARLIPIEQLPRITFAHIEATNAHR